eukprot:4860050-Karenia_brevis.AAC.1
MSSNSFVHAQAVWRKIRKSIARLSNIAFVHVITLQDIMEVQTMIWQRVHAAAYDLQKSRYKRSKQKISDAVQSRKLGCMFKKLKPFSPSPISMKDSSGRSTCNPKEILA